MSDTTTDPTTLESGLQPGAIEGDAPAETAETAEPAEETPEPEPAPLDPVTVLQNLQASRAIVKTTKGAYEAAKADFATYHGQWKSVTSDIEADLAEVTEATPAS